MEDRSTRYPHAHPRGPRARAPSSTHLRLAFPSLAHIVQVVPGQVGAGRILAYPYAGTPLSWRAVVPHHGSKFIPDMFHRVWHCDEHGDLPACKVGSQTNVVVVSPIVLSGNRFPLVPVDPRHCRITQTSGHQQALIPQESSGANPALALSVGEFGALAGQEPGHWAVWPSFSESRQHADEVIAEPNVV